jgi:hypothetical protein
MLDSIKAMLVARRIVDIKKMFWRSKASVSMYRQMRPDIQAKETYYTGKRDLLCRQKRHTWMRKARTRGPDAPKMPNSCSCLLRGGLNLNQRRTLRARVRVCVCVCVCVCVHTRQK